MTFAALAVLFAVAAPVSFDRAAHTVTFTATATGVGDAEPLEFLFVTPTSDRAYEALYVTEASAVELARAFAAAGIPNGSPVDVAACRFRPTGPRVTIEPALDGLIREKDAKAVTLPLVWTGGARDAKGAPVAETNMPGSVLSLFDCNQSLLTLDDALPQSDVYGRYTARTKLEKGARQAFTIRWDGVSTCAIRRVVFRPGSLKETLASLQGSVSPIDLFADFDPSLSVAEAAAVASALAVLDSRAVRVNGCPEGRFYYRAFLPLEKWRDRKERLNQPLEVWVAADGTPTYTVVDEDWSVEGNDPKQTLRNLSAAERTTFTGDTCFFFAPSALRLEVLYRLRAELPKNIRNWYVYREDN